MGHRFEYQTSWASDEPAEAWGGNFPLVVVNIFEFAVDGYIVGARYFRVADDLDSHVAGVFLELDNTLLGVSKFPTILEASPVGWQHCYFRPRVPVLAGVLYAVGASFGGGYYGYTEDALTAGPIVTEDVTQIQDSGAHWNGAYGDGFALGGGWTHAAGTRFGVDCLFLRGDLT